MIPTRSGRCPPLPPLPLAGMNEIIERLSAHTRNPDQERRKILDGVASGELTLKEGARRLKELE